MRTATEALVAAAVLAAIMWVSPPVDEPVQHAIGDVVRIGDGR